MATVNAMTEKGRDLLRRVQQVKNDMGECESGRLNDAVTALAECVEELILHGQPLWEKQDE